VRAEVARFDAAFDRLLDRVRGPEVDAVVYRLSSAADHSLLWHFCGAATALARGGDVQWAARYAAAMGAESLLTNGLLKSVFGRVRPVEYADVEWRYGMHRPITSSFPSSR